MGWGWRVQRGKAPRIWEDRAPSARQRSLLPRSRPRSARKRFDKDLWTEGEMLLLKEEAAAHPGKTLRKPFFSAAGEGRFKGLHCRVLFKELKNTKRWVQSAECKSNARWVQRMRHWMFFVNTPLRGNARAVRGGWSPGALLYVACLLVLQQCFWEGEMTTISLIAAFFEELISVRLS